MRWHENELVVVTGGGSGLGRALVRGLARDGAQVLTVGRRPEALAETATADSDRIRTLSADIAHADERGHIIEAAQGYTVRAVIHNAGLLDPVGPLKDVDLDAWRKAMAVNVEAPVFLSQGLLPLMEPGSRILHISSGAAHKPSMGWGAYCTSKAALFMVYQIYREELWREGILVGSVRPGVVDTPMQDHIRTQTPERFPAVDRFIKLKQNGQLHSPEDAADFILWALLETGDKQFIEHEWNIADEEHAQRWRETRQV
ncbi:SDR family NAD(P)-dependent oxidoreductase [Halorhodospira halophila]|uniref:Short-chain dehydrogenase/reductase SDR n=1 Tax=Halorhodospira halophila (strain DSM 244 / SL1) TaxID=349124 RepID=A1WSZ2_HALHL|nr:SDR family NAD(P)-dependent oxidoreductase [Halorhodospira halophila]ABM60804.1 short-chain dehydrogenase/reductase SDR [Halorhodospira halophila SL1]MBK1728459.1 short-chain dehydrogenase [Halorhodospira halophila]